MEMCNEPPSPASTIINIFSLSFLCPQPYVISFYSFLYWSTLKHTLQFCRSHPSLQYLAGSHSLLQCLPQAGYRIKLVSWPWSDEGRRLRPHPHAHTENQTGPLEPEQSPRRGPTEGPALRLRGKGAPWQLSWLEKHSVEKKQQGRQGKPTGRPVSRQEGQEDPAKELDRQAETYGKTAKLFSSSDQNVYQISFNCYYCIIFM